MQKLMAMYIVAVLFSACTKQNSTSTPLAYLAIGITYANTAYQYCLKGADSVIHTYTGSNYLLNYDSIKAGTVRMYVLDKSSLPNKITFDTLLSLSQNTYTTFFFPTNKRPLVITDNDQQSIAANYCKVRMAIVASDIINAKIHVTLTGTPLVHNFSNRYFNDYKTQPAFHQYWGIPIGNYQISSTMADVNTTALQTNAIQGNPCILNSRGSYTLATNIFADTAKRYIEVYLFKHQ
jgi:hypothetical protein